MSIGVVLIMMLLILGVGAGAGHSVSIALEWKEKDDRKKLRAPKEPELPSEIEAWDTELIKGLSDDRIEQMWPNMRERERRVVKKIRNE